MHFGFKQENISVKNPEVMIKNPQQFVQSLSVSVPKTSFHVDYRETSSIAFHVMFDYRENSSKAFHLLAVNCHDQLQRK